jgi:8-oxo-dGTP pyrophosphatase MutT (NUDIX family)
MQIDHNGSTVILEAEPGVDLELARNSRQFCDWLANLDRRFVLRSVKFQSVDKPGSKILFVKWNASLFDHEGNFKPGITFASGPSVVILVVLKCRRRRKAVLVVQSRAAIGAFEFAELAAGMADLNGDLAEVAAKEVFEEIGVEIDRKDVIELSALAQHERGAYSSPGRTDEALRIYFTEKEVSAQKMDDVDESHTGNLAEGEQITVRLCDIDDLYLIPDMKTLAALALYKRFIAPSRLRLWLRRRLNFVRTWWRS